MTNLHNYAPDITPGGGNHQMALMAEIAIPAGGHCDPTTMTSKTIDALIAAGLLRTSDLNKILSTWHFHAPYGYPIPTLARDGALDQIHGFLEARGIYSRGRFGAWKYEAGNMDHSVMQGMAWVNRMVAGAEESV